MRLLTVFILLFTSFLLNATTYYVDSKAGDDLSAGTSTLTPWRTLAKVESTVLLPGDSVLLKAGSCFRTDYDIDASGTVGNYIYHGRYGVGVNPVITGADRAINWTLTATPNVWQCGNALTNLSDDYYGGRLFFMDTDTIVYGDYKPFVDLSELTEEFDYTANGTVHYVFSTTDPDLVYDSIEVTQRERCIFYDFHSYLIFEGIDVQMGQRQGYFEGYPAPRGVTDLIWRNCFVGYTGAKGSGSAYGITAFASNILIENCRFQDNGRRAISINTYTDNTGGRRIENIIIRNNTFTRGHHTTSLDLSTMNRTGDTVMNVYFYNNYIDDSGIDTLGDWGNSNQLFTQAGIGTSYMSEIYIVGNVFVKATARNIQLENGFTFYMYNNTFVGHNPLIPSSPYGNIGVGGADSLYFVNNIGYCNIPNNAYENNILHGYQSNTVYPKRDYNLYYSEFPKLDRNFTSIYSGGSNYFYRTTQWSTYRTAFPAYDANSPIPSNPNFTNFSSGDYTLATNSPAKYASDTLPLLIVTDPFGVVDTINKYDISGTLRSATTPSIGAYEYDSVLLSTETDILTFTISNQLSSTVNSTNHTVTIVMPYGTVVTSLTPTITVSAGATINPLSGIAQNFTNSVNYTVTAENDITEQVWIVTVNVNSNLTFYSDFEDGDQLPSQGNCHDADCYYNVSGGMINVVNNPEQDEINSSSKVLKFSLPTGTTVRAEYEVERLVTRNKTYIYSWKQYWPENAFENITTNNWLTLSQWQTWPCEEYNATYDPAICFEGGIYNDYLITGNYGITDSLSTFRYRAEPNCGYNYDALRRGSWEQFYYVINWDSAINGGWFKLYKNDLLVQKDTLTRTLFTSFVDGSCNMLWTMGLYGGGTWTDSVYRYLDDIAMYDYDSGYTIQNVCPTCYSETPTINNDTVYIDSIFFNYGAAFNGEDPRYNQIDTVQTTTRVQSNLFDADGTSSNKTLTQTVVATRGSSGYYSEGCDFPSPVNTSYLAIGTSTPTITTIYNCTALHYKIEFSSSRIDLNRYIIINVNGQADTINANNNCSKSVFYIDNPENDILTISYVGYTTTGYLNGLRIYEFNIIPTTIVPPLKYGTVLLKSPNGSLLKN